MNDAPSRYKKKIVLFGVVSCVFGALFVFGLWSNGKGAVTRYDALVATDQAGGNVEEALRELRTYIYSHMNAEIGGPNGIYPPIQLSGTYSRLQQAEEVRVEEVNSRLYTDAQSYCEQNGSQSVSVDKRLECVDDYVEKNGTQAVPIDESMYTFDFVAPRWSSDIAGFSLLGFIASLLLTMFWVYRNWYSRRYS